MNSDPQILIDQIKSEWSFIFAPLEEANKKYVEDLKNLVVKHASSPVTFEKDYAYAWQCTLEQYSDFKAKELVEHIDVLERMLEWHLDMLSDYDECFHPRY
jgi:hypothetical protein